MSTQTEIVVCRASYCKVFSTVFWGEFFNTHGILRQSCGNDRSDPPSPFAFKLFNSEVIACGSTQTKKVGVVSSSFPFEVLAAESDRSAAPRVS